MSDQFTEDEWEKPSHVDVMLAFVASRGAPPGAVQPAVLMSERKLRLFFVACCRTQWHLIVEPECREAIEYAERYTDGGGTVTELEVRWSKLLAMTATAANGLGETISKDQVYAAELTCAPLEDLIRPARWYGRARDYVPIHPGARVLAAGGSLRIICELEVCHQYQLRGMEATDRDGIIKAGEAQQMQLLRDIVGNPFRPVSLDPSWHTSDVLALARGIYDDRACDRMPILADALQDAGCDNPDVLNHCRDTNQVHVRGCWVVDLLLGKE
jgi:hypothetical protein